MDTHVPAQPLHAPETVGRLLNQVLSGGDAVLEGNAGAVLDQAAALLRGRRFRVLRASAAGPGGLGLSGLMAQVTGQPDLASQDDGSLQRGAQALTRLDEGCDAIVLMLGGAAALQRTALRYLQLACTTCPDLRLVLDGLPDALDGAEFAALRTRLASRPVLAAAAEAARAPVPPPPPVPAPPPERSVRIPSFVPAAPMFPPAAVPQRAAPVAPQPAAAAPRWMKPAWAVLGMASCLAIGVLIGWAALGRPVQPETPVVAASRPPEPAASGPGLAVAGQLPKPAAEQPGAEQPAAMPLPARSYADPPVPAQSGEALQPSVQATAAPGDASAPQSKPRAPHVPRGASARASDPRLRDFGADQRLAADVRAAWARRRSSAEYGSWSAGRSGNPPSGASWNEPYAAGPYTGPSWSGGYADPGRSGSDPYGGNGSRGHPYGP